MDIGTLHISVNGFTLMPS